MAVPLKKPQPVSDPDRTEILYFTAAQAVQPGYTATSKMYWHRVSDHLTECYLDHRLGAMFMATAKGRIIIPLVNVLHMAPVDQG